MYFLADFASFKKNIHIKGIDKKSNILLNCEGYLVEENHGVDNTVFNNVELYKNLSKEFNIILNLANNHTMDVPFGISQSLSLAKKHEIPTVGGGLNLDQACEAYILMESGVEISIISAGWDIIGCKPATQSLEGVAPLCSNRLINQVKEEKNKGRKVVVYLHWDYELEIYPMPTHRTLAKRLIDNGADIILGCHSHCLQGFEKYKNKYIFYGLGNSAFDERYYFNGKLTFPEFCKVGLAVQWNPITEQVQISKTIYEDNHITVDMFNYPEECMELKNLSSFSSLNDSDYVKFFKKYRRKKKILPIFYEDDNSLSYRLKKFFLTMRTFVIKQMFLFGLKGSSR